MIERQKQSIPLQKTEQNKSGMPQKTKILTDMLRFFYLQIKFNQFRNYKRF